MLKFCEFNFIKDGEVLVNNYGSILSIDRNFLCCDKISTEKPVEEKYNA